jgi:hypothetical protein
MSEFGYLISNILLFIIARNESMMMENKKFVNYEICQNFLPLKYLKICFNDKIFKKKLKNNFDLLILFYY